MTSYVATKSAVLANHRKSLAIDLGECQQTSVRALIEARAAQRANANESDSFLSRATSLFGAQKGTIVSMIDKKTNLSKLARMGIIPHDIVQTPNMHYKRLRSAYDVASLVDYGFTWQHFLQLGFDVDDLSGMTANDFRLLSVNAEHLMRDMPLTGQDLANLKLQPHVLRELKFNFNHFLKLDLKRDQLSSMMSNADLQTYFCPTAQQLSMMQPGAAGGKTSHSAPQRSVSVARKSNGLSF